MILTLYKTFYILHFFKFTVFFAKVSDKSSRLSRSSQFNIFYFKQYILKLPIKRWVVLKFMQ